MHVLYHAFAIAEVLSGGLQQLIGQEKGGEVALSRSLEVHLDDSNGSLMNVGFSEAYESIRPLSFVQDSEFILHLHRGLRSLWVFDTQGSSLNTEVLDTYRSLGDIPRYVWMYASSTSATRPEGVQEVGGHK